MAPCYEVQWKVRGTPRPGHRRAGSGCGLRVSRSPTGQTLLRPPRHFLLLLLGGRTAPPPVFPPSPEPGSLSLKGVLTLELPPAHLPHPPQPWPHRSSSRPSGSPGLRPRALALCALPCGTGTPSSSSAAFQESLCASLVALSCAETGAGLGTERRPAGTARAGVGCGLAGARMGSGEGAARVFGGLRKGGRFCLSGVWGFIEGGASS